MKSMLVIALLAGVAHADDRAAYVASLLEAIRSSDPVELGNTSKYISVVERNKCQAPEPSVRVGCVLEAAAQGCRQAAPAARERCLRVSDVIAANRLSEPVFLPRDVRYAILGEHRDARRALARELHARYAIRVSELAMSTHFPGAGAPPARLGAAIEAHCRDVAGASDLSWQSCVAAIVWFIGTGGAPP